MNNAHVYKRHSFISKNECVRIPDESIKHDANNLIATPEEAVSVSAFSAESEAAVIDPKATEVTEPDFSERLDSSVTEDTEPNEHEKRAGLKNPGEDANGFETLPDKEALSQIYKKELEELSRAAAQAAAQSAYFDALNKKKSELRECVTNVQKLLDELAQRHEDFIEQYTNELKYMAIDIAEKMILEKISNDDAILQKLVLQNVRAVKNADWIGVELSERLVGLVDFVRKELDMPEYRGRASVIAVADKIDTFRITTEEGTLVSTISVQADNLRRAFREAEME